tara:strand:+ start:271 stop:495 length:225 start_codon:yes stop_codon:yes gene_type:complete
MKKTNWNPNPSEKSVGIDNAITSIFGINRRESIELKECVFCSTEVELDSFKDEVSLKEFHISGICQDCQDKVFA